MSVFIILFHQSTVAQEISSNLEETGIWNGLYIKGKISNKLGYYSEHHYRTRNELDRVTSFVGRPRQLYNRAGINIFFNEYFEAVIGPTLVFNFTPQPGNEQFEKVTLEPRIWHQWLFIMPKMGRFKVYHQFRFEHRWKKDNNLGANLDYTNRYRYKIFAYIPLNKKTFENKTWFFSPSAEIFMQTGNAIVFNHFEDFRIYNGIGYILNPNITFFAGHMWTVGQKSSGFEYRKSHIIRLNVMIGLDFRKTENKLPYGFGIGLYIGRGNYVGEWEGKNRHGTGRHAYLNGDVYEGQFVGDQRSGYGIYYYASGEVYRGEWKNDLMHGKGEIKMSNGKTVSGTWVEGKMKENLP